VSNLKKSWFQKMDATEIRNMHRFYNGGIEITFEKTLEFISSLINGSNKSASFDVKKEECPSSSKNKFEKKHKSNSSLFIDASALLDIFRMRWHFELEFLPKETHQRMLASDLVNPLINTIGSLEIRFNLLRDSFLNLFLDFVKIIAKKEKLN
jgi:hypothetical protein